MTRRWIEENGMKTAFRCALEKLSMCQCSYTDGRSFFVLSHSLFICLEPLHSIKGQSKYEIKNKPEKHCLPNNIIFLFCFFLIKFPQFMVFPSMKKKKISPISIRMRQSYSVIWNRTHRNTCVQCLFSILFFLHIIYWNNGNQFNWLTCCHKFRLWIIVFRLDWKRDFQSSGDINLKYRY